MDLMLKIEGKGEAIRDFITFMKTDDRYAVYACARYTFSLGRYVVEFIFEQQDRGVKGGRDANHPDWERSS